MSTSPPAELRHPPERGSPGPPPHRTPGRHPLGDPPWWLAPALGLWVVLATVAVANGTSIPVHGAVPAVVLAALAVAHGAVHRRWWIAGPVAVALVAVASVSAVGWLPDGVDLTYQGPAGSAAPKLIWVAVVIATAAEISWGLLLRARFAPPPSAGPAPPPSLDAPLRDLAQRLDRVEDLITRVG